MEPDVRTPRDQSPHRERDTLERVFEASPVAVAVTDADGVVRFCNTAAARILGIARDEVMGRRHNSPEWSIAGKSGDPLPELALPFDRVKAQGVPIHAERVTLARPDGRRVLLSVSVAPLFRSDGSFDGVVATAEDVTESVAAERALAESEERYRRITAAVTDYVYSVRVEQGRAVETHHSAGCGAVTGYSTEDFARDPSLWYDMIVPEDRPEVEAFLQQVTAGVTPPPIEHRIVRKDGEMRWVRNTPVLHRDADGVLLSFDGLVHDITERRQAQEALRLSERRFGSVVGALPMGVHEYEVDEAGALIFSGFNPAADALLGVDHRGYLGRRIEDAFPGLIGTEVPARYRAAALEGTPWRTVQIQYDDERIRGAFEVFAFQTQPRAMAALFLEITERKRIERALADSEAQLASIVRVAPIGIGVVVGRVIRRANERLCEMTGYEREELLGQSARLLYPSEEEFERVGRDKYREIAESGSGSVETRWLRKDGRVIDVLLGSTPLDTTDLKLGVTFTALDITERKRAEEALRASEERLRLAVEAADLCYWDMNAQTRQMLYGGCHEAVFGRRLPESVDDSAAFYALLHPDDRPVLRALSESLRAGSAGAAFELRISQPDGGVRWVACRCQAHRDQSGTLTRLVGVAQDVTQRRRAEEERRLFEARQQQQQRLESLGTLAAGVAHEINNPLTGIMNYAQLIANKLDDESPSRRHAQRIVAESERVSEIVRNLLAFARHDAQAPAATRLADVVGRTLALVRALIRKDQIALTTEIPEDLPLVACRPQQLQQVLLNLLTNACDALNERFPSGNPGKALRLSAQVLCDDGRRWLRTTVEDAGVGVPPEIATRIFEPFFTTKPRDVGTGLGLSISYGIVKAEHGRLLLENPAGGPTRFHVDLPLDRPAAERPPALAPPRER